MGSRTRLLTKVAAATLLCHLGASAVAGVDARPVLQIHHGGSNVTTHTKNNAAAVDPYSKFLLSAGDRPLPNNETFINLAIDTIHASQRASWEQGVTVQAILEWQYPEWSTFDASGPSTFQPVSKGKGTGSPYPKNVVLQAMRSIVAQDAKGRLAAKVTGDENVNQGSSLDSVSNLESVLLSALVNGDISEGDETNNLDPKGTYSGAAIKAYNFATTQVRRGANRIISQRMDQLQYWADQMYMGPPSFAAYGLYVADPTAQQLAYDQIRLELDKLQYPAGSGAKSGLIGHIRNEDGSWADPAVWVTGQGWAALGLLRTAAALAQTPAPLSNTTAQYVTNLLTWAGDLLRTVHNFFDSDESLWHNYVDDSSTFYDLSGSLALAAATYRLATLAPNLVNPSNIANAEAVYNRVVPHLRPDGQFGDGLRCVDALNFSQPGYTSVEALSFGLLLESARRDFNRNRAAVGGPGLAGGNGKGEGAPGAPRAASALVETVRGLTL